MNVAAGGAPVVLDRDTIGQVIGESWFVIGDAAGRLGSVIEATVDESIYKLAMHHAFNK